MRREFVQVLSHYFSVDHRARCSKMQEHDLSFCGGCYPSAENRRKRSSWASVAFWSRTSSLQCCKACPAWQLDFAGWSLAGSKFLDWLSSNSCLQKFFVIGGQVLEQPYVLVTAHPCWCLCKSKAKKQLNGCWSLGVNMVWLSHTQQICKT